MLGSEGVRVGGVRVGGGWGRGGDWGRPGLGSGCWARRNWGPEGVRVGGLGSGGLVTGGVGVRGG